MEPLISIYGTVFNNSNVIRKSINSIISKLPDFKKRFEMIIVDNYSSDGTYEILKEYQKEYPNITVIQEKCTRGKGRAIAFNNTKGKYVLTIDFDTVYLEPFKNIVYSYKRIKPLEIYPMFMMRRETMDIIGNWKDLNYDEDMELAANAISKGIKVYSVLCAISQNQAIKNREKRYAAGYKYIKRQLKNYADMISGGGLSLYDFISRYGNHGKIKVALLYFLCRAIKPKNFRHNQRYNNRQLVYNYSIYISPKELKIKNEYWITEVYPYGKRPEDLMNKIYEFLSLLDKTKLITHNSKSLLLLYHKKASKKLINDKISFFKTNVN
jgi:glycosyltransferase involved in cell wall biosynthesis